MIPNLHTFKHILCDLTVKLSLVNIFLFCFRCLQHFLVKSLTYGIESYQFCTFTQGLNFPLSPLVERNKVPDRNGGIS